MRRVTEKEKNQIVDLFESNDVSITLPFKKYAKKKFMIITICQAYQKYIVSRKKEGKRVLSVTTFYKLKPKHIRPRRALPLNLCTCGSCANFSLKRDCLIVNKVQGINKKSSTAACDMLCPIENIDIEKKCDICNYNKDCIYMKCSKCSPENIVTQIKAKNPGADFEKNVTWHKWKSVKKIVNGKECTGFERVSITSTINKLLEAYSKECRDMPLHLLTMEWQRRMYCEQRDTLQKGDLQMVIDYAKNYSHISQNEPQSAHWDRKQSTLHPIAATFPCPEEACCDIVTDEIVCISPDLKHDVFGVEEFLSKAIEMLRATGVPVRRIYEWSDNCVGQYKSRFAFELISHSKTPRMRNFYGENHGKSAADGIIGRLKMKLDSDVKVGAIIGDPKVLFDYCQKNLATQATSGCQHYRKHFLYFPAISRPKEHKNVTKVKNILKQHSIRTTGKKGVLEVRELTCFCPGCQHGTQCHNSHMIEPWQKVFFTGDKSNINTHWNVKTKAKKAKTTWKGLPKKIHPTHEDKCPSHVSQSNETWASIGEQMSKCTTFKGMKEIVDKIKIPIHLNVDFESVTINNPVIDQISVQLYPEDAPTGCKPISVYGDGNCFTRCLSVISYGNESRHKELRARLVAEAVTHKQYYLDNDYLNLEGAFEADLAEYYSIISESYMSVNPRETNRSTIEKIYEAEVVSLARQGQYCGMWQMYQAANVLGRPIKSVFPTGMIAEYRLRSHRIILPIKFCLRQNDCVCIMWTKITKKSPSPNHFVPVMNIEYVLQTNN